MGLRRLCCRRSRASAGPSCRPARIVEARVVEEALPAEQARAAEEARPAEEDADGGAVSLLVAALSGEAVASLALPPTASIRAVKREVQSASGVPAAKQQLVWRGAVLGDDSSLASSGISGSETLTLVSLPRRLAVAGRADGSMLTWDLESGQHVETFPPVHCRRVDVLVVDWPSRRLLSSSADKLLVMWDLATETPIQMLNDLPSAVTAAAVDWRGSQVLAGFCSGEVVLFALGDDGQVLRMLHHRARITDASAEWEQKRALTASYDHTLTLFDLQCGEVLRSFCGHQGIVLTASVDWGGSRLLSGGADSAIILWDLKDATPIDSLHGHTGTVRAIRADWAHRRALTASSDASIGVWDLRGPGMLTGRLLAHEREVNCLAADWASRFAVSADCGGMVVMWDLDAHAAIRVVRGAREVAALVVDWRDAGALRGHASHEDAGGPQEATGPQGLRARGAGSATDWLRAAGQTGPRGAARGAFWKAQPYRSQLTLPMLRGSPAARQGMR